MRPALTGGCLCGAVRYTLHGAPKVTAICHCTHCQRQSGSVLSVNAIVQSEQIVLQQGKPKVFHDIGDSGKPVLRHFCGDCGSPLFSELGAIPGLFAVKVGTLDDASSLRPALEAYTQHAAPWAPAFVPAAQRHAGAPQ